MCSGTLSKIGTFDAGLKLFRSVRSRKKTFFYTGLTGVSFDGAETINSPRDLFQVQPSFQDQLRHTNRWARSIMLVISLISPRTLSTPSAQINGKISHKTGKAGAAVPSRL